MKFLSTFDIFGHKVNFTFQRRVSHKTICGGILSILVAVICLPFWVSSLLRISNREVLSFSTDYTSYDPRKGFNPGKYGFDMAFGFLPTGANEKLQIHKLDPRIGKWRAFYKNHTI